MFSSVERPGCKSHKVHHKPLLRLVDIESKISVTPLTAAVKLMTTPRNLFIELH